MPIESADLLRGSLKEMSVDWKGKKQFPGSRSLTHSEQRSFNMQETECKDFHAINQKASLSNTSNLLASTDIKEKLFKGQANFAA